MFDSEDNPVWLNMVIRYLQEELFNAYVKFTRLKDHKNYNSLLFARYKFFTLNKSHYHGRRVHSVFIDLINEFEHKFSKEELQNLSILESLDEKYCLSHDIINYITKPVKYTSLNKRKISNIKKKLNQLKDLEYNWTCRWCLAENRYSKPKGIYKIIEYCSCHLFSD